MGFSSSTPTTITGGSNIAFNQINAVTGLSVPVLPFTGVTIQTTGVYNLSYGVTYSSSANSVLVVRVNGVDLTVGALSMVATTNGEASIDILATLTAGDIVSLGVNGTSLTLTTIGTAAYMTIAQIA